MFRLRSSIIVCSIVSLILVNTACSRNKAVTEQQSTADMFSNRPVNATPDLFVITLKSPPLLTVSTKTKDGWQVPADAKNQILAEQAALEAKIAAISTDIKIVYRYRLTLNGLAVFALPSQIPQLLDLPGVTRVENAREMARPQAEQVARPATKVGDINSVNFIGADKAHALGFTGKGMRVGVLDTGIDYTHKMLGGSGVEADYEAIDPKQPTAAFPNKKVVGGIDLVGTDFNPASPFYAKHLPVPDNNPIDEAGHGTHVAGTVAGVGDDVFTYSGVAPDADLYAIKVFGADGSTNDAVVIAGFEFAADPNGDLNPDDQLHVINLSLGGGFGQPQILYNEAVGNLTAAGTVVVASAGNSGPVDYIVGAPSTSDKALSVAASIDGSLHNWKFAAVRFISPNNPNWLAKATEGPISKPISEISGVEGELVDIGMADTDLSDDVKAQLSGKVALIERGKVPFAEKLKRAFEGGAVGAVVYNNDAGKPIPMGGEGKIEMPAIMVSQALGMKLKEEMKLGAVKIQFKTDEVIEQPELVDTITDFSSKGPRSEDNILKPEIAAPGGRVISAAMGKGAGSVEMDGTSMAAPHMAGVMALLRQAHPDLTADELKALAMNTAKPLSIQGAAIPMTLQGAGRVQVAEAITTTVVSDTPALSLGRVQLGSTRTETRKFKLRNLSSAAVDLSTRVLVTPGLSLSVPAQVSIPANGSVEVPVQVSFEMKDAAKYVAELNGRIEFSANGKVLAQIPALGIRTQASAVKSEGAPSALKFTNSSPVDGFAMAFNLIGEDVQKGQPAVHESWKGRGCDLQSAGYRIVRRMTLLGLQEVLQFGIKVYNPVTTWITCELSVLIDQDGDGEADQEIASIAGVSETTKAASFGTVLLDAPMARALRLAYEADVAAGKEAKMDISKAALDMGRMAPFPQSTVAMLEVPLSKVARRADGSIRIKIAAQGGDDVVESDDYLGEGLGDWTTIAGDYDAQPYLDIQEAYEVKGGSGSASIQAGKGSGKLVLYYPMNELGAVGNDNQSEVVEGK